MQLIVYKHSGVTEIFFNIAYVRYWFLYKSFNTKKNFFKKRVNMGIEFKRQKYMSSNFFCTILHRDTFVSMFWCSYRS